MSTIDLPFGLNDLEKVFAVSDLLDNTDLLIKEFKPEVSKFLVREGFFMGPFKRAYIQAFDELIINLIRGELVKHFQSFTPEEIVLLTDPDFLKMIAPKLFETNSYRERILDA